MPWHRVSVLPCAAKEKQMKTVDSGEFFHAPTENIFSEYKQFTAEQYFPVEIAKPPTEVIPLSESFAENQNKNTQSSPVNANEPDLNDLTKRYNQLNGGSEGTAQGASGSSGSATSQAAATTSGASSGSSVASATSSAAVGATSVTAVVVAVVLLASSLFPFIGQLLSLVLGNDFVAFSLNIDSVIAGDSAFDGVLPTEFRLELVDEQKQTKSVFTQSGEQTYVFGGLKPNTQYTYNLVCTNAKFAQNPICYTDKVTTSASAEVTAICDTTQTYVTLDYDNKSATVHFAAYVSDYFGQYGGYSLYVTTAAEQAEKEFLFATNELNEDNYFRVAVENVNCNKLDFTVTAQTLSDGADGEIVQTEIFNYVMDVDLPEEWQSNYLTVDETSLENASTRTDIAVGGKLLSLDKNAKLSAAVTQFNKEGAEMVVSEVATLSLDTEKKIFNVQAVALYGVRSFVFDLFVEDESGLESVYTSPKIAYEQEQSFAATFTRVQPNQATLTYSANGITVNVNPDFVASETNCFYKLSLLDGSDNLLDEYTGTDIAEFNLAATDIPSQINFVYAECATFANEIVTYAKYKCDAVSVSLPTASLSQSSGFDGDYFTLDYEVNTSYDLQKAQLVLDVTYNGQSVQQVVSLTEQRGTVALEKMVGDSQEVKVTPTLRFGDNQKDGATHELRYSEYSYEMLFDFAVKEFVADVSQTEKIAVRITFEAKRVPSTYKICLQVDGTNQLLDITQKQYDFSSPATNAVGNVSVYVVNQDETYIGYKTDYVVSKEQAVAALDDEPLFGAPNPGDAAITFNQDGTINVYREVWLQSTEIKNLNVMLNARVVIREFVNDEMVEKQHIDCFTNQRYAVLENIPRESYIFIYYYAVKVGNIIYNVKECGYPSGSILDDVEVTTETNATTESTVLTINFSKIVYTENKVTVNGVDYALDETPQYGTTSVQVTLPQGTEVKQLMVYIVNDGSVTALNTFIEQGLQTKGSAYEVVTVNV